MVKILEKLIRLYQKLFSPDHSFWAKGRFPYGYCRFHPSCSEYMRQALLSEGVFSALKKGFWRILRCNPFSTGGYDPVTKQAVVSGQPPFNFRN